MGNSIYSNDPLVLKHGNGKSPVNGGFKIFHRKVVYTWSIFQQTMFDCRRVVDAGSTDSKAPKDEDSVYNACASSSSFTELSSTLADENHGKMVV